MSQEGHAQQALHQSELSWAMTDKYQLTLKTVIVKFGHQRAVITIRNYFLVWKENPFDPKMNPLTISETDLFLANFSTILLYFTAINIKAGSERRVKHRHVYPSLTKCW